ncbi:hypothetical protein LOTGIDRAFT_235271 [Lottia gigantea]|uniref:Epidermal growth factor receptor substrate 15-like 1 n=1 Tax=Lottia gigantea TaxID=225164 RepID=V3Z728_LOTGI|nr:hypothetical protein LOTGIDRAFT_235271 [Lottia gigantea]ESO86648.1 hypothetical protein LOTGIDRAFT_235271 [Lottia gigantea]
MAAFPPLASIAGSHAGIYEAYFLQADPKGTGSVGAYDAAKFMKKSGLNDTVLSKIWDLSDPTGKGYLEKVGFFVGLKYIALAQNGHDLTPAGLIVETPPPNLGPVEPVIPQASTTEQWDIKPAEKMNYDKVFDSLQPVNGLLSGDKVKPVLLNSKLPTELLGKIWDLSDCDKDGYLDRDEFAVAMSLVYRARENNPLPGTLPTTMIPPSKRNKGSQLAGAVPVLPGGLPSSTSAVPPVPTAVKPWVVSAAEKLNYDAMFKRLDTDFDGLVSGAEIRDTFVKTGLNNTVLAHIWSLCDMGGVGKLNSEQFALAMFLVQQKLKGIEPPSQLTPEMIPPSARPTSTADPAAFGVKSFTLSNLQTYIEIDREIPSFLLIFSSTYNNPTTKVCDIKLKDIVILTVIDLIVNGLITIESLFHIVTDFSSLLQICNI